MMAPLIAGIFPVLIFAACRQRGVAAESRVIALLSGKPVILLVLAGFASIYVWQAVTDTYAPWYRGLSAGLALLLAWLLCDLWRKGAFTRGAVILIEKGRDGWDPKSWKVFEQGRETRDIALSWKAARNDDFQPLTRSTAPVRTLSAVRVHRDGMTARRVDVTVIDRTSDSAVGFAVDDSDPAVLDIVLKP